MKTRRVYLMLEVDSATPVDELRRVNQVAFYLPERDRPIEFAKVEQCQANVSRETATTCSD